jgi:hypothetical protein
LSPVDQMARNVSGSVEVAVHRPGRKIFWSKLGRHAMMHRRHVPYLYPQVHAALKSHLREYNHAVQPCFRCEICTTLVIVVASFVSDSMFFPPTIPNSRPIFPRRGPLSPEARLTSSSSSQPFGEFVIRDRLYAPHIF